MSTSTTRSTPRPPVIGAHPVGHRLGPVVDRLVGAGRAGAGGLLVRAHGRDDGRGAEQPRELDRVMADRPGAAGDEHDLPLDRPVGRHGAVRRQGRDAEAGALLEAVFRRAV